MDEQEVGIQCAVRPQRPLPCFEPTPLWVAELELSHQRIESLSVFTPVDGIRSGSQDVWHHV